jgi:hypothetical protein
MCDLTLRPCLRNSQQVTIGLRLCAEFSNVHGRLKSSRVQAGANSILLSSSPNKTSYDKISYVGNSLKLKAITGYLLNMGHSL